MRQKISTWISLIFLGVLCTTNVSAAKELNRIGVSVITTKLSFFNDMINGIRETAEKINPEVKLLSQSADVDLSKQSAQIDNMIAAGVDLILLNPVDTQGITPAVKRAKAAGIPVIGMDSFANGADINIINDNRQGGRLVGEFIAHELKGAGNVVILTGAPIKSTYERINGLKDILDQYNDIHIISEDQNGNASRDSSLQVMTNLLTAHPKIDAVYTIYDDSSVGAALAIKQANRDNGIFVTGIGGNKSALTAMVQPDSIFKATATLTPYKIGQTSVELGYKLLQDEDVSRKTVIIPVDLITQKNATEQRFIDNAY